MTKQQRFYSGLMAITSLLFSLLFISCFQQESVDQPFESIVATKSGLVQGAVNESKTVTAFKGIPFAAPPVGALRWREPHPPEAWDGVRDATKFCPSCMQAGDGAARLPWTEEYMNQTEISEDCLFLNIWTPARFTSDNLPVLMWIYGGGFREGSGSIAVYDGEELAKKGIILVTVNYRLGVLGYLAHPELTAESPHNASGNYGYLDQVAALQWIRENIAAFGGNPDKVTISGQSAGALSVQALTASPLARGLFNRAIIVSGPRMSTMTGFVSGELAEAKGEEFAESKGAASLEELRALPAEDLVADFRPNNDWSAIIDGWFLTEPMAATFEKGELSDVPTMAGLTADDRRSRITELTEFVKKARDDYGDRAQEFLELYPAKADEEAVLMATEATRDQGRFDAAVWAEFRGNTAKTPVYTYFFKRAIPWPEHPEFGAFHTSDVIYWFNNLKMLDRPWTEGDKALAETASSYWVNFVTSGNPNGEGLPEWPDFNAEKKETQELDLEINTIPVAGAEKIELFSGSGNTP